MVAALIGAKDGIQDATDQLDAANDQSVNTVVLECSHELRALPRVIPVLSHHVGTADRFNEELGAPRTSDAEAIGALPAALSFRKVREVEDLPRMDELCPQLSGLTSKRIGAKRCCSVVTVNHWSAF